MLTLKQRHAPANGLAFWIALSLASILGCNTGDCYASLFGHIGGLPVLIAAFAAVLFAEARRRRIPVVLLDRDHHRAHRGHQPG